MNVEAITKWVSDHKAVALAVGGGLVAFLAYAWIRNQRANAAGGGTQPASGQLYLPQLSGTGTAGGSGGGGGGDITPPLETTAGGGTASTGAVTPPLVPEITPPALIPQAPVTIPVATAPTLVLQNQALSTPVVVPPAPPAPAAPSPAYAQWGVPDNWQQIASVPPAPTGYAATPIVVSGSIVGENLWTAAQMGPSAPWQQEHGFAPAPQGYVAEPISQAGDVIGERFVPNPVGPPPVPVKDYFYYQAHPNEVRQSIYGPIDQAGWELLPASARL